MTIDFGIPDEILGLEASLRRFGRERLRPDMRDSEARGCWPDATLEVLDRFALSGLDVPERLGGEGAGMLAKVVALEAVAWGDAGGLVAADSGPATAPARACPDRDLAAEILGPCLSRRAASHVSLVSADEGASPPVLAWAPAWPPPRHLWVSAGAMLLLFDVDPLVSPEVEAGAFGASGGVTLEPAGEPSGSWSLTAEDASALRGRIRLWPAAVSIGIAQASFDYACTYAQERVVAGRPVAHHQGNAFLIAEAAAALEAARLSVRGAAARIDAEEAEAGTWASLAYLESIDVAPAVCDLGVQLLGGHGYVEDHPVEKWYRESRMLAQLWGGRALAVEDAGQRCADPGASIGV